ncbi:MAG: radical SAM protein [Candidatus Omnitrophota bacterium]
MKTFNYQIEVDWHINDFCNFNCIYCFDAHEKNDAFIGLGDMPKIVDAFNNSGHVWLIGMTGGEPFFVPHFIDLCLKLTKNHFISINTNLSHKDIILFAEYTNPEKVTSVHCSLHIQERERLNLVTDFINKFKLLQKKGFNVFVSYLLYPHLIKRFIKDYECFKSEGIILMPKVFRGNCARFEFIDSKIFSKIRNFFGSTYPQAYSSKQREIINRFMDRSIDDWKTAVKAESDLQKERLSDIWFDRFFVNGPPNFKGKFCEAGKKFVVMNTMGDIYRCHSQKDYLGNIFIEQIKLYDKIKQCIVSKCGCPAFGYKYILEKNNSYA